MAPVSATPRMPAATRIDQEWAAVIACTLGLVFSVGTLTLYSFGVFVHPLATSFGWSRTALGGAVAISQLSLAVASPFWGALVDRLGPRPVLVVSVALMSLVFASLSLLRPPLWHLYLAFAALPVLAAGASPLGYSAVLIRCFERHLGLALGLATMGVGLGATIIPPLAQKLVAGFGWRDAYAIIGLVAFLVGIPCALIATRHARGPLRSVAAKTPPLLPTLRTRTFLLLCAMFFLLGVSTVGALAQLVPMMIDRGFAPREAAGLAALTGFSALVGRGGVGWVLDRVRATRVVATVSLLASGAFLLLALGGNGRSTTAAAVLLGGAIGAEVNFVAYLVRRHFDPVSFGRLYGIVFGVYLIGGGLGPLLLGASFDHLGGYRPILLLFTVLAAIAAAVALAIPTHRVSEPGGELASSPSEERIV